MKTEDKSPHPARVRIAVLGKVNVGKSALTVRYLTRRFIGEYRSNTDLLYRQTVTVNSSPLEVEIVDVSGESVEEAEGREAALKAGCPFFEVSVAENSADLYVAFEALVSECQPGGAQPPSSSKARKFSVSKMIGTLIGNGAASKTVGSTGGSCTGGGTVVECHKADLHRSRVLQRRQNFTATASL